MAGYKEYRSVTEFPLHLEKLNREQLEASYQELRDSYRSLVLSRGQLVRRQTEAKNNLTTMDQKLKQLNATFEKVQQEKQQLQRSLTHNLEVRNQLENWGNELAGQVDDLTAQMSATTRLLEEFETAYDEVREESGVLSVWKRFYRLLTAATRLLNTDVSTLMPQKRAEEKPDEWTQETPANVNRSLLDEK